MCLIMNIPSFIKTPVLAAVLCTAFAAHAETNLGHVQALLAQSAASKTPKESMVFQSQQPRASTLDEDDLEEDDLVEDATHDPFEGESDPWDETLELDNSGMLDGIYHCNLSLRGDDAEREVYISVNGKSTGETVFIIGDMIPGQNPFFGYGTGHVFSDATGDNYTFAGVTSANHDFFLIAEYDLDGIVYADGEVTVTFKTTDSREPPVTALAEFSCISLW